MLIGLVGKPNAGKSTLFNALTHGHAQVASYPFTTIKPNLGVALVSVECACGKLEVTCSPRVGKCEERVRKIPVNVVDVAGLVPGAHAGKGMGNQFLNDLVAADALVIVVDASGSTDGQGNPTSGYDPCMDVQMIQDELFHWIHDILKKNLFKARGRKFSDLLQYLSGIKVSEAHFRKSVYSAGLEEDISQWSEEQVELLARKLLEFSKPLAIAANKADLPQSKTNVEKLRSVFQGKVVIPVSGDYELALNYALEKGLVKMEGGKIVAAGQLDEKFSKAIQKINLFLAENASAGSQELLNKVVFGLLGCIVAFPVEDEKHFADHKGQVLPDAILLRDGSTPVDLARKIHSDLADNFLYALDAKKKMRMGAENKLSSGDVIKIVSSK